MAHCAPALACTHATAWATTPAPWGTTALALTSVNVHLELHGRQVQLTLRDRDEDRLLARLEAVLQRFPVAPVVTSTSTPTGEPWCAKHQVPMHETIGKTGARWFSHRTSDGWCKG